MCQHNHNSLFPTTFQSCFHLESNSQSRTVRWKGKIQLCLPAWLGPWVPGDPVSGMTSVPWLLLHGIIHLLRQREREGTQELGVPSVAHEAGLSLFPSTCHWACPFHTGANSSLSSFMASSLHVLCVTDNDGSHYFIWPPQ